MTTENVVKEGGVSEEGTPSVEPNLEAQAQIDTLIQQKVAEAMSQATEQAKRELQSIKDKSRAEIETAARRARLAEGTLGAVKTQLQGIDPDMAKEIELAELRAKEQGRSTLEQEEAAVRGQAEFHQKFLDNLSEVVTSMGIDPSDKRIDWAQDAPDYLIAQRRVLDSAQKIQKEVLQAKESVMEKRLKDLEAKVGQANIEVNSDSTAASEGAGSDAEFVKGFGSGDIPMNKANVDRYNKIINSYE